MPETAPDPITVNFEVSLDTVVDNAYTQTGEDDYASRPVTLADLVAERVAAGIVQKLNQSEAWKDYTAILREQVEKRANDIINEKLVKVLEEGIVPTDSYGYAKGERTTLAEVIRQEFEKWAGTKRADGYGSDRGKSNIQKVIESEVDRRFEQELRTSIEAAKKQALSSVTAAAQKSFLEILGK